DFNASTTAVRLFDSVLSTGNGSGSPFVLAAGAALRTGAAAAIDEKQIETILTAKSNESRNLAARISSAGCLLADQTKRPKDSTQNGLRRLKEDAGRPRDA